MKETTAGPLDLCPIDSNHGGQFIVFDGIDGAGKSSLVQATAEYFRERGREVVVTRSPPRESVERPLYEKYMYEPKARNAIDYRGLVAVLMGDRLQHARDVIWPGVERGKIVISDRYVYSGAAHLVARGYVDELWFSSLTKYLPRPMVACLAWAPVDVCRNRVESRGRGSDGFIENGFYERLYKAYEQVASRNELMKIDTGGPVSSAVQEVLKVMSNLPLSVQGL